MLHVHVKADDHGIAGFGQQNVGFIDIARRGEDNVQLHFVGRNAQQRVFNGFNGALHVGFEHNGQAFDGVFAVFVFGQTHQRHLFAAPRIGVFFLRQFAFFGGVAGFFFAFHNVERIAHLRRLPADTQDFRRHAGADMLVTLAVFVNQRADAAVAGADDKRVAHFHGAFLHQHRGHHAAFVVALGFQNDAHAQAVGIGFEFHHFRLQGNHFQQFVNIDFFLGRNFHKNRGALPFLGHQAAGRQVLLDAVHIGAGQVNFIDGHDNGRSGGFGVLHGLYGLGHNAVGGGHDQHHDIRGLCAARAHGGKGFVARGVQKG